MLGVSIYGLWLLGLFYWASAHRPVKSVPPGEELMLWLKKFNWDRREQEKPHLPQYKFFTPLVNLLLEMSRRYGGQYKEALQSIKESLNQDLQFEKKVKEFIWGSYFQKFCIFAMSWGFIILAQELCEIKLSLIVYQLIFTWQLVGLLVFPLVTHRLRNHYFNGIGQLWLSLYVLKAMSSVSLSRSEVFKLAKIYELQSVKHKNLEGVVGKLQASCELSLKQGGSYAKDIEELIQECRFLEKWHIELFEKRINAVKLLILSLFFLPSYLAFIYFLLHSFLHRI